MFSDAAAALSALSFQLETYRWEDHVRRMRALNQETNSLAVANARLDYVIAQYDALARRFNELVNAVNEFAPQFEELQQHVQIQQRELQAKDTRIAELEEQLQDSRATEAYLRRQAWADAMAQIDANQERRRREDQARSQGT
jgi:predicted RNase H-like nuclease (RuvC/YqgF family)